MLAIKILGSPLLSWSHRLSVLELGFCPGLLAQCGLLPDPCRTIDSRRNPERAEDSEERDTNTDLGITLSCSALIALVPAHPAPEAGFWRSLNTAGLSGGLVFGE